MREQPERLELGELAPHGRRRHGETGALDERLRADRLAGRHVLLDDAPEDVALALDQLDPGSHLQVILAVRQTSNSAVTPPPRKRPRAGQRERRPAVAPRRGRAARAGERARRSSAASSPPSQQRLVEPEPEHHALPRLRRRRRAARAPAAGARPGPARQVARRGSARSATAVRRPSRPRRRRSRDSRARASSRGCGGSAGRDSLVEPAEVGRLVPAVAGPGQRLDDPLEVVLHRVGLTLELFAVRVREARSGLRLELVAGQCSGSSASASARSRSRSPVLWPGIP